jgi:hypothetical protein
MNVVACFGTYLPILYCILFQKFHIFLRNLLFRIVALVYKTENVFFIVRILFSLLDPELLKIFKGLGIINVAYENDSVGTFIIWLSDASEPFLTSGVPNLQFDVLLTDV